MPRARKGDTGSGGREFTNIITLTTDFGTKDGYVAAMKGVIWSIFPDARLLDITHEVPPQDIRHAAFLLATIVPYIPAPAIHLAVVDPGVGTKRRPILIQTKTGYLIGPDNGLFTLILWNDPPITSVELSQPEYHHHPVSHTFHGRDIFAPVAAHLARALAGGESVELAQFGPPAQGLVKLEMPVPRRWGNRLVGEVIHIDRFGNLITNVDRTSLTELLRGGEVRIHLAGEVLPGIAQTYGEATSGHLVAVIGSSEYLEIAVSGGNAQQRLGVRVGEKVEVEGTGPVGGVSPWA